jgi:hypothetical protein
MRAPWSGRRSAAIGDAPGHEPTSPGRPASPAGGAAIRSIGTEPASTLATYGSPPLAQERRGADTVSAWSPSPPADITVTVRHRCPTFVFGSALGPGAATSWWWSSPARDHFDLVLDPFTPANVTPAIETAIYAALAGAPDYRRHLDELAELP